MTHAELQEMIAKEVGTAVDALRKHNQDEGQKLAMDAEQVRAIIKSHLGQSPLETKRKDHASAYLRTMTHAMNDTAKAAKFIDAQYSGDPELKAMVIGENGTNWVMPEIVVNEIIELLRPASIIRKMGPIILPVNAQQITLPKQTGGATAQYIGSNDDITTGGVTFGMLQMNFKKLAAMIPLSNDLIRYSTEAAQGVIRDDLVYAIADAEDEAFLRYDGTENRPKGLRYWCPTANVLSANGTVNAQNVVRDLARLQLALQESDCRMRKCGWIMAPRTYQYLLTLMSTDAHFIFRDEMLSGNLLGFPFGVTNRVPINLDGAKSEIYFADFSDMVIAENMNMTLDASREASWTENGVTVSAYQRDMTLLRAITEHDFGCRHAESIAILNAVTWALA